ncbi:hypothetical protein LPJ78_002506 [Coemansia sp. RSA 989]|nr:hypothetical protein BX667DRAFT_508375 [Coemansia mojavensis]KAJ1865652.1 hypothetical protein LPJ78_002506 [Coemansia sp. RSA 989]
MFEHIVPVEISTNPGVNSIDPYGIFTWGLCILSTVLAAKVINTYYSNLSLGLPAAESPTLYLLSWLAGCDILASLSLLGLTLPLKLYTFLPNILLRAVASAQLAYFILLILLSFHILSISGTINRNLDILAADYYGPISGIIAFVLAHPIAQNIPSYQSIFLLILPLSTLACLGLAAWKMSSVKSPRQSMRMVVEESYTIRVWYSPIDYARFSKALLGLFVGFHALWVVWGNTGIYPWLALCSVCARGLMPFWLCKVSPFRNIVLIDEHEHQE